MDLRSIHGFNYSGSWGSTGVELWRLFDADLMRTEVARGKAYFPGWNAVRWWLSPEGWIRNPEAFRRNFDIGLGIFAEHGIPVMPVLFNRWHDQFCDFGGVYVEHFLQDASLSRQEYIGLEVDTSLLPSPRQMHARYMTDLADAFGDDERIFAWDLCNEPRLTNPDGSDDSSRRAERKWLAWVASFLRRTGLSQPLTVGNLPSFQDVIVSEPYMDFISFHPYYVPGDYTKQQYGHDLDVVVEFARDKGKQLLASETVWGAVDNAERVEILEYTLGELRKRQIGFTVHALHHSLVADLHAAEYGPVGYPGRLEFINADGSLRAGHGKFNDFAPV